MSINKWEGYPQIDTFQPRERTPRPVILSDDEQRRIDRSVDAALISRCGYGHGPVRRLSAEETAALSAEVAPIEKVRVMPYMGFHDRRMIEGR